MEENIEMSLSGHNYPKGNLLLPANFVICYKNIHTY